MAVSIGVNERDGSSIYNSQLLFDADRTMMEFDGAQDCRNGVDLKCSRNKSLKSAKLSHPAALAARDTVVGPTQHSAAIDCTVPKAIASGFSRASRATRSDWEANTITRAAIIFLRSSRSLGLLLEVCRFMKHHRQRAINTDHNKRDY